MIFLSYTRYKASLTLSSHPLEWAPVSPSVINNITRCLLVALVLFNCAACKGAECAATLPASSDLDSDCLSDSSDNCPFTYNPLQRDTDENNIGDECEDEEAIASVILPDPELGLMMTYPEPTESRNTLPTQDLKQKSCDDYYLVGCHGQTIGVLTATADSPLSLANEQGRYGSLSSPYSLFNKRSTFGSKDGTCSAFNSDAPLPPALFCLTSTGSEKLIGYLSKNPHITQRLDSCHVLNRFGFVIRKCF